MTTTRLASFAVASLLGISLFTPAVAVADESPMPTASQASDDPALPAYPMPNLGITDLRSSTLADGQLASVTLLVRGAVPATEVQVETTDCRGVKHTAFFSGSGDFDARVNTYNYRTALGTSIPLKVTYFAEGYTPATTEIPFTHPLASVGRANCDVSTPEEPGTPTPEDPEVPTPEEPEVPTPEQPGTEKPAYPTSNIGGISSGYTSDKQMAGLTVAVRNAVPGTSVKLEVLDCFGGSHARTIVGGGDFDASISVYNFRTKLGASIPLKLTYSADGYTPAVREFNFSHSYPEVGRSNCASVDQPDTSTPSVRENIDKWSSKRGVLKVGRSAWVTKTQVESAARVSYRWYVRGQVIDRNRFLNVKKSLEGKRPVLVVRVTQPGYEAAARTFTYRKVR